MLLSLFLQILLILAAPLRKIVSGKWLDILLWPAYLLADGTAIFAIGLISSKQIFLNSPEKNILHTFWAPFLLAHLGGPDPITAFALEDNELWLRHLFSLITQCIAVAYVFYQFLTPDKLLVPSLLMFLCGFIKYSERTYALYCASANTFRDSILKEPDLDLEEFTRKRDYDLKKLRAVRTETLQKPDRVVEAVDRMEATDLNTLELDVVQYAFLFFTVYKGLAVDLIFSITQRHHTREFFSSCDHAFRIVEVELNFLYDVLFTKLPVVYHRFGFSCHAVSFLAIVTSLVLFHYADKKHLRLEGFEVGITYTLLIGGIVLEVIAFFMLVFSDWTVVKIKPSPDHENPRYNPNEQSWECMFSNFILSVNVRRRKIICWLLNIGGVRGRGKDCVSKPTTGSRWEESISGYNFIYYCLHRRSGGKETFFDQFGITAFLDKIVYVKQHPLPFYMKEFIFQELKRKLDRAYELDAAKKICSATGEWVLRNEGYSDSDLILYVENVEYDESLLLWHIATEIWFTKDKGENIDGEQEYTRIAKLISDYMIYFLVMKPGMMSAVSRIGLIRFRDTCAVAKSFLDKSSSIMEGLPEVESHRIVCEELLNFETGRLAYITEEDRGMYILLKAARLAKLLEKIESSERWNLMSKIWVELLSSGAIHIKPNAHAQQLSKGGELVTIVWLLMTQLGLGDKFHPHFGF
nr:PREDICTED: uncharacterized protein LOC108210096 [Daucus carota subsp. sativus]XP_017236849.1 PREDICTED: uncharacterized protein LOC108210096 [Daucus carota subsp. sativus]XP_017236850.1 PREDICTED: uncharacterized protein LOC108210096 [Daucus carota subsp. sativus]XP_017236851.1 PREDICTED: uncharacterized protein LOC108210096 [Daucus carota subsp. sativus]XP_017236852.1 PREDICTED: uncharacterized protein LOC108210096 [Daucus carota subsp. sativus]